MVQVPQYGGRFGALAGADAMAVIGHERPFGELEPPSTLSW